jgi:hypothetical protein
MKTLFQINENKLFRKELEKYELCPTIQKAIDGLAVHAMGLRQRLAEHLECDIEDTEIVLDVEGETKLTMTARLKER